MIDYQWLKVLHILSATVLFGTGLGSAFYKWRADKQASLAVIAITNKHVVTADWLFTTPSVIIQPITGIWMLWLLNISFDQKWVIASFVLYAIAGLCWLPVVWLQIRMRDMSMLALTKKQALNFKYQQYVRWWFWLGVPAFISIMLIYGLMVFKPV